MGLGLFLTTDSDEVNSKNFNAENAVLKITNIRSTGFKTYLDNDKIQTCLVSLTIIKDE